MTRPSLSDRLRVRIQSEGPIRFDEFMALALFDAAGGYYASDRARIGGPRGDFYTSVTATRMFGRCLADHFIDIWISMGRPSPFALVEQGANDATLACDILSRISESQPDMAANLEFRFIEPFEHLRRRQQDRLRSAGIPVLWHETIEELPPFVGIHYSNEFVDALPVRLFRYLDGWQELYVGCAGGQVFEFVDVPGGHAHLPREAPEGYVAEVRPASAHWLKSVASKLLHGMILVIDYGFPRDQLHAPWRREGTLSCYSRHRRDDNPLENPGSKDITSHVDFTTLHDAALECGLKVDPILDQYHFVATRCRNLLLDLEKQPASPRRIKDLAGIKTLLHPEIMGTQFKYFSCRRTL